MIYWLPLLLFTACGEGGDNGNDTILTGFSGVLIFGILAWVIFKYVSKKNGRK